MANFLFSNLILRFTCGHEDVFSLLGCFQKLLLLLLQYSPGDGRMAGVEVDARFELGVGAQTENHVRAPAVAFFEEI